MTDDQGREAIKLFIEEGDWLFSRNDKEYLKSLLDSCMTSYEFAAKALEYRNMNRRIP